MYECPKDCLSCANSFSEPAKNENEPDILHCVEKNGKIVKDTDCCELYNDMVAKSVGDDTNYNNY